jgi:hypothetical protein
VSVSADRLTIGPAGSGTDYLFATYTTLSALVDAIADAGAAYTAELLPSARPDLPSTYLKPKAAAAIGPTYDKRVHLDVSALWITADGGRTHVFVPLPIRDVLAVSEDGVALASTDYQWVTGNTWLIRRRCGCAASACSHPAGRWSAHCRNNVQVVYRPMFWGTAPAEVKAVLLEAFGAATGQGPIASESFGDYGYTKKLPNARSWQELLAGSVVRSYGVRFHP